jgi:hypothetical protein
VVGPRHVAALSWLLRDQRLSSDIRSADVVLTLLADYICEPTTAGKCPAFGVLSALEQLAQAT